jgi:hypothetical protein
MSIHIMQKVELQNVYTGLLKWDFLIKVHQRGDGHKDPTEPRVEFQDMLKEFRCLFSEPTCPNSLNGRQTDFKIKTDLNGKIPFCSPYRISRRAEEELQRQIGKAIRCGWIQPSRNSFGSPVLFVPKPASTLYMCIDYRPVNAITVKDRFPVPHIEDLLNSMHSSCRLTKLDLVACYHPI